ncbi:MAG: hypothetical protein QM610_14270 [Chitinophagaceae bacterium]
MDKEKGKEILQQIAVRRMQTKAELEMFRGLSEMTGQKFEEEINEKLDLLKTLEKLEEEIKKLKK